MTSDEFKRILLDLAAEADDLAAGYQRRADLSNHYTDVYEASRSRQVSLDVLKMRRQEADKFTGKAEAARTRAAACRAGAEALR
jgi:hypothetical protein